MRRLLAVPALALVLAGCGDGGGERAAATTSAEGTAPLTFFPKPAERRPGTREGGPKELLPGVWDGAATSPQFGRVTFQVILRPEGAYSYLTTFPDRDAVLWHRGRYLVFEDRELLRFEIDDWEPKRYCGPVECVELARPPNETDRYDVSETTLVLEPTTCPTDTCGTVVLRRSRAPEPGG